MSEKCPCCGGDATFEDDGVVTCTYAGCNYCTIYTEHDNVSAMIAQAREDGRREVYRELAVEHDDPRLKYLTVQIPRVVWDELRKEATDE